MQSSSSEDTRNVVPRWRSLLVMDRWELEACRTSPDLKPVSISDYIEQLERWRRKGTLEAAGDIFSLGVATSDKRLVWEGGMKLLSQIDDVEPRLVEAVQREISPSPDLPTLKRRRAALEQSEEYLRSTIRMLKKRLTDYSRNPMLALELSRHYCILGQYPKAEHWLRFAHALAPQDRTVLRAMVQFYDVVGDLITSLRPLWAADGLKYDPLIQSAEMAATQIAGRGSKVANIVKRRLKGLSAVDIKQSEAAMAIATLEKSNGVSERAVFKFVAAGLADPTENALAQAVWVSDQSQRRIKRRFPELDVNNDAYEARAQLFLESRQYEMSIEQAFLWSMDQPFQAHPLAFICTCSAVYSDQPTIGLTSADRIMDRHNADFNAVNAALLSYCACGITDKAEAAVNIMKRLAYSNVEHAFLKAGQGLLCYLKRDFPKAQEYYFDSIRTSRKIKRADLSFTAAAFFMIGEAQYSFASEADFKKAIEVMDKVINRVSIEARPDVDRLWARGKQLISRGSRLAPSTGGLAVHEGSARISAASQLISEATGLYE